MSGAGGLTIDRTKRSVVIGSRTFNEGDLITIDGSNGQIMAGKVPTIEPELAGDFGTLMEWADDYRRMDVRTNAETPDDCRMAKQFGAEGIGLCRTEHMFFDPDRISLVRQMILAENLRERQWLLRNYCPRNSPIFVDFHCYGRNALHY